MAAQTHLPATHTESGVYLEERTGTTAISAVVHYLLCHTERLAVAPPPHPTLPQRSIIENWREALIEKEPKQLQEMRGELQCALDEAYQNRERFEERVYQGYIYSALALWAFSYPDVGTSVTFDGKTYRVDVKMALTPGWFSSPLPAYGLLSTNGAPLLLFLGSPYPAGEGFVAAWLSNFTPGHSVGGWVAQAPPISNWLAGKENVTAVGLSLGGAQALHAARHPQVSRVYALNPTGLYRWSDQVHSAETHIYTQENDPLFYLGYFPSQAHLYRLRPSHRENWIKAHVRFYCGKRDVRLIEVPVRAVNRQCGRHLFTTLHLLTTPIIAAIGLAFYALFLIVKTLYNTFTLKSLGGTRGEKNIGIIASFSIGLFLLIGGSYALTHPHLIPLKQAALQVGKAKVTALLATTVALGALMACGSVRASLRKPKVPAVEPMRLSTLLATHPQSESEDED